MKFTKNITSAFSFINGRTKFIIFMLMALSFYNSVTAQNDTLGFSQYSCRTILLGNNERINGDIYKTADSSIFIKHNHGRFNKSEFELMEIPVSKLDYFSVNKKGRGGRGFLIGGAIGAVIGGLIGYASVPNDNSGGLDLSELERSYCSAVGITVGFVAGAMIGLVAGNAKFIININGDHEKYKARRKALAEYSIMHE
jgi:hypothetical protein